MRVGCLIIHGYTGGPYEIESLVTHLKMKTDWKIVVPTLEGHGRELELTNVSYEKWLAGAEKALQKLMKKTDIVYVIGFSMGGMIAAYLAARHKVERLVLLAPARKYISFKYLAQSFGEIIGDGVKGKLNENELYLQYKAKLGEVPLKANVEFLKLVRHTKPYLEKITAPTFIIQGKRDEMVPFKTVYTLEEEIGAKEKSVVLFEKSGHHLCLSDDKEILNTLVYEFLTK